MKAAIIVQIKAANQLIHEIAAFNKSKIKKIDSAEVRKVKLLLLDLAFVYFFDTARLNNNYQNVLLLWIIDLVLIIQAIHATI